ncbi:hypothetical protein SAMN04488061_3095 [Filomicrobium insigne]|uniref:SGNH hydrolase-type esterase domain-containing protein n=1 Tax=Filomicrobium insigne TaxID=418854 RepID=A0A1H0SYP7_9HYPH|nr:SGNH/GDSL hydrolase family protein [Filomicrobium insigne]SDP46982.1 hypothetical protein SAMN04488061_3095 [Filomicrobium insigne]
MGEQITRKELATRLAEAIKDRATLPLLQLLCDAQVEGVGEVADIWTGPFSSLRDDILGFAGGEGEAGARAVGIWEEEPTTGEFVRSRRHIDLWRFCANVDRIRKKGNRKRVAFLGESVARGFFFSPQYGPAQVLEKQLAAVGPSVEVVDLAQSNCGPWWLVEMTRAAAALQPDAIVVFAGNNWRAGSLSRASTDAFVQDGGLLAEDGGLSALMARQQRRAAEIAEHTVRELAKAAHDMGVPLILVLPEINVADWLSCPIGTLDVPLMSELDTVAWVDVFSEAREAADAGDFREAEDRVQEAINLDGGTCSASLELLAHVQLKQGKTREASAALRRSRDIVDETRVLPGIFSVVAEVIRKVGREVGALVVDLPHVYHQHFGNSVPGRGQFLDYCHLNAEGIRVAMAGTAQAVVQALFHSTADLQRLVEAGPSPSPEQEGWAHLLAGIHNAHWGQGTEICSFHFKRAASCYPPIGEISIPLVYDAFRHGVPPLLLSSFGELVKNQIASTYLMGYGLIGRGLIREHDLLKSIVAAFPSLGNISSDPDFVLGEIDELDLLDAHWLPLMDGNRWYRRAFKAAYELESAFPFVSARSQKLELSIVSRVPGARQSGDIIVKLNGAQVGRVSVQDQWCDQRIVLDSSRVKQGLNSLRLIWPNVPRADLRSSLKVRFETGQQLDTRTHFGHLHELRISAAT